MYDFFKRNNKKLLAVFGVLLMIAFLMPNFDTSRMGLQSQPVGSFDGEQVYRNQVDQAEQEWEFLARRVVVQSQMAPGQWDTILSLSFVPQQLWAVVRNNPTDYYLLQQEARRMGMVPPLEEADEILQNPACALVNTDRRILAAAQADETVRRSARQCLANLLMVLNAHHRAMSVVKVSQPLLRHEVALRLQQIKVRLVDFSAKDYMEKVPAPTDEQLQKHFEQFAQTEPGGPETEQNPFGFGYKYPNRVKLQYIAIPREEVRRAVQATKDDYEWEVEAQKYYQTHQSEFPTTAPAPATQEAFSLAPSPTTVPGPTTKPFNEVKNQILSRVVEPLVDRLQLQIQSDLTTRLSQDYHAYQTARPSTTAPATAPAGLAFESFEYLQKLAADIQSRHKVTITIVAVADSFKTADQLLGLADISKVTNFAQLAVASAEPFVTPEQRNEPVVLSVFEPSRAMTDDDRNVFIYRLTATDPAHAPAGLDEIRAKVEEDWKRAQAFELAKQDAQKLLDSAKEPGLDVVASDRMKYIGPYSANTMVEIKDYPLSTRAQTSFIRETYEMLGVIGQPDHPRPITLVPMPAGERVAVAELVDIQSGITPQTAALAQSLFANQIAQQYQAALANGWFNPASIGQRLNYNDLTAVDTTQ